MTPQPLDHSARAHALLGPSSAHRWLVCTPSAVLESREERRSSSYADEGTLAHEFAQVFASSVEPDVRVLKALRDNPLYDPEMEDHARDYADYIAEKDSEGFRMVESKLNLTEYVPESFGTVDCLVFREDTLSIIDYKYGRGVRVSAVDNPQLKLYALGALYEYGFAFPNVKTVELCIFQPRIGNVSEWTVSVQELTEWATSYLIPRAKMAFEGRGSLAPGEHCRFCAYSAHCQKLKDYAFETVSNEFKDESGELTTTRLGPSDWAMILERADVIEKWLAQVKSEAMASMLNDPGCIPGFKIVEGTSKRALANPDECIRILRSAGLKDSEIFKEPPLKGIGDLTKILGKEKFSELLADHITKPKGKPVIAPESDKRDLYAKDSVINLFQEEV